MELSKGANEAIVQAHMLRMSSGGSTLCVEHLLYGLLLLARYLDEPLNKQEYREEAEALREEMAKTMRSIESAACQLKKDAPDPGNGFADGRSTIGRATELAEKRGKNEIDAQCLWTAVLESQTPTVLALRGLSIPACAVEDAKYGKQAVPQKPEPAAPPPPKPEPDASEEDSGLTASQLGALLALLAAAGDNERQNLKNSAHKPPARGNRIRRTKMGLFTYRGGTVAAAIQYFLFGLLVPFALLVGLDLLTGAVASPPTPLVDFLIGAFIVLWMFYLVRGANKLFGLISNAFGHFLDLLTDCCAIFALADIARTAYGLADYPTWMRIVVCALCLLVLLVGAALYQHLQDQSDPTTTKILFKNVEGTVGKVFFRYLTRALILPLLICSAFWIGRFPVVPWMEKTLWILGFFWAWDVVFTMWSCLAQRADNSRRHKGRVLVKFLMAEHALLFLPGFVLFLYWLFGWFPMEIWVIVLFGGYGAFWLLASIANLVGAIKEDS